ncbi:thermonuclease family protein [Geobacillus subterraneus]|uniref:thermonuclease family protein n=1 Tax=Geobacillus subterraneus TaxID=129338 RepID=UPI001FD460F7|nr:thermonuclease family protein [Geobacillus subterraneus]WPZ17895.1 thermonuclease family protein [Geobacillus subterraneus]
MKQTAILFFCLMILFPASVFAHPGTLDELGGHFRNSDCTYLLHEPTALAKQAKTKEELIKLIQTYNGNERCKRNLTPERIDLDGHALGGNEDDASLRLGRTYEAALVECVDGDTAKFRVNGHVYTTRFLFIDTPESTIEVEPYGKEASQFTCSRLQQGNIVLETDGNTLFDKYQRLLAWVWVDHRLLQEELAKAGLVEDVYDYGNYKYESRVREAYEEAKRNGVGMYGGRSVAGNERASSETKRESTSDTKREGTPNTDPQAEEEMNQTDRAPSREQEASASERSGHPILYTLLGAAAAAAVYWLIRQLK